MTAIAAFNALVREWADRQPAKYRRTALAFGYRCDRRTHSFSGTLQWVSKQSRKRDGEGVSRATLVRHLAVFAASGVITVERRRDNDKNQSSVYHVDFDKLIDETIEVPDMGKRQRRRNRETVTSQDAEVSQMAGDAERAAFLASLDVEPPDDIEPVSHVGADLDACPACVDGDWDKRLRKHVAGGGQDPWNEPMP